MGCERLRRLCCAAHNPFTKRLSAQTTRAISCHDATRTMLNRSTPQLPSMTVGTLLLEYKRTAVRPAQPSVNVSSLSSSVLSLCTPFVYAFVLRHGPLLFCVCLSGSCSPAPSSLLPSSTCPQGNPRIRTHRDGQTSPRPPASPSHPPGATAIGLVLSQT